MNWAKTFLLATLVIALVAPGAMSAQGTPLPGNRIPQFVDPLPLLGVAGGPVETVLAGSEEVTLNMLEFKANVLPSNLVLANGQPYSGTWVFGYRVGPTSAPEDAVETYLGPVIVATRHNPTQVRYVNNLTAEHIAWRDWVDQSVHWANPGNVPMMVNGMGNPARYTGPVPAVAHLHGGEDAAITDGGPEAWYLSDQESWAGYTGQGPAYYAGIDVAGGGAHPAAPNEAISRYPNSQEAAPLWFHDHLLGGTRLNATFAGLAGGYPLIDPGLALPTGLHPVGLQQGASGPVRYSVPLVLQDRMFDTNGQLYFPNVGINAEHPYWVPEFVGDAILVNGKTWPYLDVDQQRYRFLVIDGASSRPFDLFLQDPVSGVTGPRMWVISTDGGYLDSPVLIDPNATGQQAKAGVQKSLRMMPGERYEIIVDFADPVWKGLLAAKGVTFPLNLILRNVAPTVNGNPKASLDGRVMQFRVSANAPADASYNPASGTPIRSGSQRIKRLVNAATGTMTISPDKTRELTLVEIAGPGGPLEVLVNNSKWDGLRPDGTPIPGSTLDLGNWHTELPEEGTTEVWEIVNMTMDSHPIHLHAIQFQILNRQAFDTKLFGAAYANAFPGSSTIVDPMTGKPYASRVFIPGFGPPLDYAPSVASGMKYGGNPDVKPFLVGAATPPLAQEAGWKDTAIMPPGTVTRIAARFAPQDVDVGATGSFPFNPFARSGAYVWHCHITDHEDNEMMRPYYIVPNVSDSARSFRQGIDY